MGKGIASWEGEASIEGSVCGVGSPEVSKVIETFSAKMLIKEKKDQGVVDLSPEVLGCPSISHSGVVENGVTRVSEEIEKCNNGSLKADSSCNVEEVNVTFNGNSKSHT
ncbi:hypothetical protein VNO78_18483 [Psophocarpus tetragonolobus]|uniref:Uncharacterized protein n=1 Tax=Psophocarpus tetragonolobus TaxID=3891 RepID=A0AAN9SL03_PSOTE